LPWKDLLTPAAHYAVEGFPVSWRMGRALQRLIPVILADPGLRSVYLDKSGAPLVAGSTCRPHALGRTFAALLDGPEALYGGSVGVDLAHGVRLAGGALDLADLTQHTSTFADPHALALDDVTVIEQPLPSQGLILLVMVGLPSNADPHRLVRRSAPCWSCAGKSRRRRSRSR
jgi:gamma-glutamyltranspeptidase/glutathione hydrolase